MTRGSKVIKQKTGIDTTELNNMIAGLTGDKNYINQFVVLDKFKSMGF
jgi:hypothetical protein